MRGTLGMQGFFSSISHLHRETSYCSRGFDLLHHAAAAGHDSSRAFRLCSRISWWACWTHSSPASTFTSATRTSTAANQIMSMVVTRLLKDIWENINQEKMKDVCFENITQAPEGLLTLHLWISFFNCLTINNIQIIQKVCFGVPW